jgi:hemoglobin-like flavoprotein
MFKGNTKEQARKLMSMVTLIVTKLDKLDDIMQEIKYLAIRHVKYQVEEKHYDLVGQSLLWTLENGLKDKWTSEVAEAWTKVYTILANAMITTMQKEKENVLLK